MIERLLQLQTTDTAIDQLRYRREHLPEAQAAATVRAAHAEWERSIAGLRTDLDRLAAEVEQDERAAKEIDTKRDRLRQQLRTVIAPREAEALQHEIATLTDRRNELDDRELVALETQAETDDRLQALLALTPSMTADLEAAESTLSAARQVVDDEIAEQQAARDALRAEFDEAVLARYDRLRVQFKGVAIAKLNGSRCEGCHLDMSPAELDAVRHAPADELPECPNCSRLLVR